MIEFLHGLNTMGFALAGLFFFRFWRQTKDVFFVLFAAAFWIFSIEFAIQALLDFNPHSVFVYVLRLLAFALIMVAIFSKNVKPKRESVETRPVRMIRAR